MENKSLPGDKNHNALVSSDTTDLPYEILPGKGLNSFELLCFRILMAEKKTPHFFARSGQDDYGVDITVEKKSEFTVFQCKNLRGSKKKFYKSDFKKAFAEFNDRWVKEKRLSKPQQFIYCTSGRIAQDKDSHTAYINAKKEFKEQFLKDWGQSIEVDFWDSDILDEKLKNYPEIVAEMFGSEWAARHCRFYGWDSGLFINIKEDQGKSLFLKEYFKKKHRIYIPNDKREELEEKLNEHGNILIRGFPGTGKTFLALALAEGFTVGPASAVISPYVYYVNFKREFDTDSFKKGIQQRGFLPSVFIFDDYQEKSDLMIDIFESLTSFLDKKQVFFIFLFRTTLTSEERRDEDAELRDLFEPDAVIDYTIDYRLFREIAVSIKPGLTRAGCSALFNLTGCDLFILDFILEKVGTDEDIEAWLKEKGRQEIYQKAIDTYFKGERRNLGAILGLLALAQFDIGILPGYIDCIYGSIVLASMKEILDGLVVTAGSPARCFFLHSSLAELLCRAAVNELQHGSYIETVTRFAIEYFQHLADAGVDYREFNRFLSNFITGQLKLGEEDDEEKKIKIGFLQAPVVIAVLKDRFDRLYPYHIAWMLWLLEGEETFFDYFVVLKEKIESGQYLETVIFFKFNWVGLFFSFLKEKYPELFDRLKTKVDTEKIKILCEKGNFRGLVNFIKNSFDKDDLDRLDKVLGQLGEKDIEQIVERTIKEGRSIGALNFGLRELKTKGLLEKWEIKIRPVHYLRLIAANGTFLELIHFLQCSTKNRARNLMQSISREWTAEVLKNTIVRKPSLNPLPWGVKRLLHLCGGDPRLFDEKIGMDNLFHLIITIGNPGILVQVMDILSKSQQQTLIQAFRALQEEIRTDFILQGNFHHFCKAAAHYPQLIVLPGDTGTGPGQLVTIISRLIEQSDFFSLNSGIRCLEEIDTSDLKPIILGRLSHSLDLLPREKIESTANSEKVNYLALLNRLEKLDADIFHKILHTIDRKSFVKEKYFFSSLGYLLYVFASLEVDVSLKPEILELANDDLIAGLLAKPKLLSIFLFLWNTYSLFITVKDKRHFNHWLNPAIKEGIFKMIKKNKKLGYFTLEYEHLLMLMGLLAYLGIQPSRLRTIFSPSYRPNTSRRFLDDKVEKLDFLPGCFFLLGVEFFLGEKVYSHYWDLVKEKKDRYKMQTAALRELLRAVSKGIN